MTPALPAEPLTLSIPVNHDPETVARVDALLARLRAAILASDELAVSIARPRPVRKGQSRMLTTAQIWWETEA